MLLIQISFAVGYGFGLVFSYCLGLKAWPGVEKPLLDGLDKCCVHPTECGGMQILHVFSFNGGLVRIVAFWNFLCSVGVCVGEG